jgi:hypothetical protein
VPGYETTLDVSRQLFDNPAYKARQQAVARSAQRQGQAAAARIESQNLLTQQNNEQLAAVLREATQAKLQDNPREWWQWWHEYVEEHPKLRIRALQSSLAESLVPLPPSSIAVGTPVWTETGRWPIERVQVGDLVLAQHPETGELAYKPVLRVIQSAAPTRRVTVKETAFLCTAGLALWHGEKGWWLARDLETDSLVQSIFGPENVTENVEMIEESTRHLVVADFGTFFISDQAVLVHDATRPRPATHLLPGLRRDANLTQQQ